MSIENILDIESAVRSADSEQMIYRAKLESILSISNYIKRLKTHTEDVLVGEPMHTQLHLIENIEADLHNIIDDLKIGYIN